MNYQDRLRYLNESESNFATAFIENERCLLWNEKIIWSYLGYQKTKDGTINYSRECFEATTENGLGFVIVAKNEMIDKTLNGLYKFKLESLIPKSTIRTEINKIYRSEGVCRGN